MRWVPAHPVAPYLIYGAVTLAGVGSQHAAELVDFGGPNGDAYPWQLDGVWDVARVTSSGSAVERKFIRQLWDDGFVISSRLPN